MQRQGSALPGLSGSVDAATATIGLPGFVVLAAAEYGGELELLIETTESGTGCPECGVVAVWHDRKPRWVRDLPAGGRPVTLVWLIPHVGRHTIPWWSVTGLVLSDPSRSRHGLRGDDLANLAGEVVGGGLPRPTATMACCEPLRSRTSQT